MLLSQSSRSGHHKFRGVGCSHPPTQQLNCQTLLDYITSSASPVDTHRLCLTTVSAQTSGHQSTDEAALEHQHQVASGLADCCTDSGTASFAPTPLLVEASGSESSTVPAAPVPLFWQLWFKNRERSGASGTSDSNGGSSVRCSPSAMCFAGVVRFHKRGDVMLSFYVHVDAIKCHPLVCIRYYGLYLACVIIAENRTCP